jgi:hypothetical protein
LAANSTAPEPRGNPCARNVGSSIRATWALRYWRSRRRPARRARFGEHSSRVGAGPPPPRGGGGPGRHVPRCGLRQPTCCSTVQPLTTIRWARPCGVCHEPMTEPSTKRQETPDRSFKSHFLLGTASRWTEVDCLNLLDEQS